MNRLPVVDSALEGFRVTRERPLAVAAWAGWLLLGALAGDMLLTAPGMARLMAMAHPTPAMGADLGATGEMAAAAARVWPALLALLVVSYGFAVVFYTAVLRAVFRPGEAGRTLYLRLGRDEARQVALAVLLLVGFVVYALVVSALAALVITLAQAAGPPAGPMLAAVALGLMAAALLYPAVRLSLAPSAAFASGRIDLRQAWADTRGLFWPLLAVYLLALALSALVYVLATVIVAALAFAIAAAGGGGVEAVRGMTQPDVSSLAALFAPASLLSVVFGAAIGAPVYVVTAAASAGAFRNLVRAPAAVRPAKPVRR